MTKKKPSMKMWSTPFIFWASVEIQSWQYTASFNFFISLQQFNHQFESQLKSTASAVRINSFFFNCSTSISATLTSPNHTFPEFGNFLSTNIYTLVYLYTYNIQYDLKFGFPIPQKPRKWHPTCVIVTIQDWPPFWRSLDDLNDLHWHLIFDLTANSQSQKI